MKKLSFVLLILIFWVGQAWADSITLRPRDCVTVQNCDFTVYGCVDHEDCVNEATPDNDETYVFTSAISDVETFYLDSLASGWDIDSLVIKVWVRKTGMFPLQNAYNIGFIYWFGDAWLWQDVRVNIGAAISYEMQSGCSTEDEYTNPWTSATVNNHGFGLLTVGSFGLDEFRETMMEVVVWGTAPAAGDKAKERRMTLLRR